VEAEVTDAASLSARLSAAGFVAADEEAAELLERSNGDPVELAARIERRLRGEPLAWITGFTDFCGLKVRVDPGVYVPRWQSEPLARRAATRLSPVGVAVDVCTGSGAIAMTLRSLRPNARVIGTDVDARAVACARSNGVEAHHGDLFAALPYGLEGRVDVIVGVVPYVPTHSMTLLARDTLDHESTLSYDGGPDGVDVLRRVLDEGRRYLRPGGAVLLEMGGDQDESLRDDLNELGFVDVTVFFDDEGDLRGLDATWTK
jgi:release factor glutamine methyltransferase